MCKMKKLTRDFCCPKLGYIWCLYAIYEWQKGTPSGRMNYKKASVAWAKWGEEREIWNESPLKVFPLWWELLRSTLFSSVQSLSRVLLFSISLSITISRSSLRLMSIESVMPSSHLILCCLLLLLPPILPSIRVFSNESTLRMRWPKYWSFSFSIIPPKEIPRLIFFSLLS